jgi:hypothetical protein
VDTERHLFEGVLEVGKSVLGPAESFRYCGSGDATPVGSAHFNSIIAHIRCLKKATPHTGCGEVLHVIRAWNRKMLQALLSGQRRKDGEPNRPSQKDHTSQTIVQS